MIETIMYNPSHLNECEKEKERMPRHIADGLMIVIGIIASLSSIPQVLKIFQTGTVAGISMTTQLLALFTVIAWFIYGLYIKNKPLVITTFITTFVLLTVVVQIIIYR